MTMRPLSTVDQFTDEIRFSMPCYCYAESVPLLCMISAGSHAVCRVQPVRSAERQNCRFVVSVLKRVLIRKVLTMKPRAKQEAMDWHSQLQQLSQRCDAVSELWPELDRRLHGGGDIRSLLARIRDEMGQITKETHDLHETMVIRPIRRMFSPDRLNVTEQQYLLARAAGFNSFTTKSLGVSPISDYEAYRLCVYEDDEIVWFWHPDQTPPGPDRHEGNIVVVRGKAALSPEEIDTAHLRPEQLEFIRKHRPDILPRLGLLKQNRRAQPVLEGRLRHKGANSEEKPGQCLNSHLPGIDA